MKLTFLFLCIIAAAFMLLVSCAQNGEKPPNNIKKIMIHIANDKIMVTERATPLRYDTNEQARWEITPPDLKFKVIFNKEQGSPFEKSEFNNDDNESGRIKDEATPEVGQDKYFPYVVDVDGFDPIDPGIIIWRH